MGLDSFWKLPKGTGDPLFEPELHLCGGMCSNHGQGSFRGKVYNYFIENATGQTLYAEVIDNIKVKDMAKKLQEYLDTRNLDDFAEVYGLEISELKDLCRMFNTYSEAGATLHGWW
jgi:hypothetical protein